MANNLDIVLYALVAGILLVRLWAVLGRRNDEDRRRPNPFAAPGADKDDAPFELDSGRPAEASVFLPGQAAIPAPLSLMGALGQVKQLDPAFDEKQFLQTARAAFTSVVTGFAKGDLAEARALLAPAVLAGFQSAMAARARAFESLQTRILRIKDADTEAARVEGDRAFITVRFVSEQENILRDAAGNAVHGMLGKTEEITDLWTFARDMKAPGAVWQLAETRS